MNKPRYIYILSRDCAEYDFQNTEDLILEVSTDFKFILSQVDFKKPYHDEQIIISRDCDYQSNYVLNIGSDMYNLKNCSNHLFRDDKESFEYACNCYSEWLDKKYAYVKEKKLKEEIEKQQRQDEKDRREYERLKKKFEGE